MRAGGRPPTEKCYLELALNCRFLETLGARVVHVRRWYCSLSCRQASAAEKCVIQVREKFGHLEKITGNLEQKISPYFGSC